MIVDRASWHTSPKLDLPDNIRFIPLPSGSPELNPQENVWAHLREKFFANKNWQSLDQLEDYLVDILESMRHDKETIKSIANFCWLNKLNLC
jgi:transposase